LALGGFFIEAGAHNGEDLSNTLFFEVRQLIQYCTFSTLCTEASVYAPYSLLLISNKFWMEGGVGWGGRSRDIKLLYAPERPEEGD
jgi:hypothetical protein